MRGVLDALESFGERMYEKQWYRVIVLVFISMFIAYTSLWCHEFFHYWYATAIAKGNAYIMYHPTKLIGYCYTDVHDLMEYAIGGLGTAIVYFLFWFFAASFPHKLSLPFDMSLFYVVVLNLIYFPFETIGLGMGYGWIYDIGFNAAPIVSIIVTVTLYLPRLEEYIEVG